MFKFYKSEYILKHKLIVKKIAKHFMRCAMSYDNIWPYGKLIVKTSFFCI